MEKTRQTTFCHNRRKKGHIVNEDTQHTTNNEKEVADLIGSIVHAIAEEQRAASSEKEEEKQNAKENWKNLVDEFLENDFPRLLKLLEEDGFERTYPFEDPHAKSDFSPNDISAFDFERERLMRHMADKVGALEPQAMVSALRDIFPEYGQCQGTNKLHVNYYERRWLINQWLPADEVMMFSGKGGAGKSRLMLQIALACTRELSEKEHSKNTSYRQWLGHGTPVDMDITSDAPFPVVYANYEDSHDEMEGRITRAFDFQREEREHLSVLTETRDRLHLYHPRESIWSAPATTPSAKGDFSPQGRWLLNKCVRVGARLLILDPLSAVFAQDENSRHLVRPFLAALGAWAHDAHCAVALVSHPPKSGEDDYSGSTDWHGGVRTMWAFKTVSVIVDENGKLAKGMVDEGLLSQKGKKGKKETSPKHSKTVVPQLECKKLNYGQIPLPVYLKSDYPRWDMCSDLEEAANWKLQTERKKNRQQWGGRKRSRQPEHDSEAPHDFADTDPRNIRKENDNASA